MAFKTRYNSDKVKRDFRVGLTKQEPFLITPDVGLSTVAMARRAQKEGQLTSSGAVTWRERSAPSDPPPAPDPPAPDPVPSPSPPADPA